LSARATTAAAVSPLVACLWLLFQTQLAATFNLALVAIALASFAYAYQHQSGLRHSVIVASTIVALAVAVAIPPRGSHDVYSYAMYGRMVAHYHQSPYSHLPNEHPHDVLLAHVATGWQHVPSVYGPLFTGISAGLSAIAGSSALTNRLLQQGLTALVTFIACFVITRHRKDALGWLVLGLNPATLAMVNGGHNDLLTGVLLAGGAYWSRRSPVKGGTLLACAILIKASALVPAIAVLIAAGLYKRRAIFWGAPTVTVLVVGAYCVGGGLPAIRAITHNSGHASRASLLALPHHLGSLPTIVIAATVLIALLWYWLIRHETANAAQVATLSGVATLYASPYVLPWYSGLTLPAATLSSAKATTIATVQSSALLLAYSVPAGVDAGLVVGTISIVALPLALITTFQRLNSDK
jgi:alpha-1,6-mannosyltransferase